MSALKGPDKKSLAKRHIWLQKGDKSSEEKQPSILKAEPSGGGEAISEYGDSGFEG